MIVINSVSIYPNTVRAGQNFKVVARVSDLSWEALKNTYSNWNSIKDRYPTWQAIMEDNPYQTSWDSIKPYENWGRVKTTYFDWFNVKDNTK